jgi:hypothetical protein
MAHMNEVDLYYEMTGDEDEPCIEPVIFMKRHIPCVGIPSRFLGQSFCLVERRY